MFRGKYSKDFVSMVLGQGYIDAIEQEPIVFRGMYSDGKNEYLSFDASIWTDDGSELIACYSVPAEDFDDVSNYHDIDCLGGVEPDGYNIITPNCF